MEVKINEKTGEIVITAKIGADGGPFESKSGKSVLLLSTGGTQELSGVTYKGHQVSANFNLTIPNPARVGEDGAKAAPKRATL